METKRVAAERLLLRALSPEQKKTLREAGYFDVRGRRFTYRLFRNGHVSRVNKDGSASDICIQLPAELNWVFDSDEVKLLALKIKLEATGTWKGRP